MPIDPDAAIEISANLAAYLKRGEARPAFQRALQTSSRRSASTNRKE